MRILCPAVIALLSAFFIVGGNNNRVNGANSNSASFRRVKRKPVRRRGGVPDWPFAFLVSHISKADGDDWCVTASNGVSDGDHAGFALCDFVNAPSDQLFLLDNAGRIRSNVDETMCVVVDEENDINPGHSILKFRDCNAQASFGTFTHDRGTDLLRVKNSSTHCVKQTGNGPDTTDSLRAFTCDAQEAGMIFDYQEHECSTRLADVGCCRNRDCPNGWTCEDYACVCRIDTAAGIECCDDNDCSFNAVCSSNACIPLAPGPSCNIEDFGTDCCRDVDCPMDYFCESNTCLTPAFSLVSTSRTGNQDYCIAATVNRRNEIEENIVYERCRARNAANQLWHSDLSGKIHSNIDFDVCVTVGPNVDRNGLVEIRADTCYINTPFHHDSIVNQMRLDQDETYCLSSFEESNDGAVRGMPCLDAGVVELVV